jgi:hypothetical protein
MFSSVTARCWAWEPARCRRATSTRSLADDPDLCPVTTVMQHYAKAVAHATLRNFGAADSERARFYEHLHRIPAERKVFDNTARSILSAAENAGW